MAHPPRTSPLRADAADESAGAEPTPAPRSRLRSVLLGVGVGTGVGVAVMAIAFSIVAIPMFILASTEPDAGLDRSLVRTGLFKVALPASWWASGTPAAVGSPTIAPRSTADRFAGPLGILAGWHPIRSAC
jgi:hypothetical protein